MAIRLADVVVAITADTKQLDRSLDQTKGRISAFGSILQGIFQGIGQRLFDATAGAIGNLIGVIGGAIDKASDLNETINKTNAVFGESTRSILEWSKSSATAFGLSQQAALEAASSIGNLFRQLGAGDEQVLQTSESLVQLAADFASFHNVAGGAEEVLVALQAAFRGEFDALQRFVPTINAAAVSQQALVETGKANEKQLTALEKATATYTLVLQGAGAAQGDFANTSGSLANATRTLESQLDNLQATLGQAFLPIKTAFIQGLSAIVTAIQPFAQQIIANFARGLAAGVRYITPALMVLRQLFTFWLKPGSPPKLLPELVAWGAAAASEWIGGWAKADFAGLQQLGSAIESILRSFVTSGNLPETDLVQRVLGSRDAIADGISEFRKLGAISQETMQRIVRNAGPAGQAVADLVATYLDLSRASDRVQRAQENLNRITERYDAIIDPLTDRLDSVREAQRKLSDEQRKIQLQNILRNFDSSAADKRAAELELQQIALEDQIATEKQRKDAATDTAQTELAAAKDAETGAQEKFDIAQATLQQQVDYNNLLGEQRQLEERIRREREAAAKQAQAEAEALQSAILQYQLGLSNTQGKLALLRAELAKTQTGSIEYYQLLGQIADLEQQSAEEATQKARQLADAQLAYQLQVGDTASDLELLRKKLGETQEGSLEYFDLLTQIAAKEQELANQRASGAGALIPDIPAMGDIEPIEPTDLLDPETKAAIDDLVESIKNISSTAVEVSPGVQKLGEAINTLLTAIGLLTGIDFNTFQQKNSDATAKSGMDWANYRKSVEESTAGAKVAADEQAEHTAAQLEVWASNIRLVTLAANGDWAGFWEEFKKNTRLGIAASNEEASGGTTALQDTFNVFFGTAKLGWTNFFIGLGEKFTGFINGTKKQWDLFLSDLASIGEFAQGMYKAGQEILDSLWDGLKSKWDDIKDWWSGPSGVWTNFRNVLPFSEPKDPTSPLRGLDKAGESIINQIRSGMEAATAGLNGAVGGLAPTSTTNNNLGGVTVMQNFYGSADAPTVRQAAGEGLSQALRAAGVI